MQVADAALILPDGSETTVSAELFVVGFSLTQTWAGVIATNKDLFDSVGTRATLRLATGDHVIELGRELGRADLSFRYSMTGSGPPPF